MPDYVMLMKLTEQGARDIDSAPARIREAKDGFKALDGKLHSFYITMGAYDYVAIGTLPDDKAAAFFALALSRLGNVRTETMPAFGEDVLEEMVVKLGATPMLHPVLSTT